MSMMKRRKLLKKRKRTSEEIVEEPFDLNALLRDVNGGNNDAEQATDSSNVDESPNTYASQFYADVKDSGAPIYPGNTTFTRMSTYDPSLMNLSYCGV